MTAPHEAQILGGYMARLDDDLGELDPGARADLMAQVESHIAEARAAIVDETDADLLNILDRLGSPEEVAAEATGDAAIRPSHIGKSRSLWSRHDWFSVLLSLTALAGGIACGLATVMALLINSSMDVGALASLGAAVLGVAGGVAAFRRRYVTVGILILAIALDALALSQNVGQPSVISDAGIWGISLLSAGAALGTVLAIVDRVSKRGMSMSHDPKRIATIR
jgi:uncharacterized membrane protein